LLYRIKGKLVIFEQDNPTIFSFNGDSMETSSWLKIVFLALIKLNLQQNTIALIDKQDVILYARWQHWNLSLPG